MKRLTMFVLLISVVLLAQACSGATPEPVTYSIEMSEFTFTPAVIEVKAGQPVTIELLNTGTLVHEIMFGRQVVLDGSRPAGYQHDLFGETGVEPHVEGAQAETEMSEHGHGEAGFMVTLPAASDEAFLTFTPTADMVGEWEIGCFEQDGVHYDAGMKGTLVVTE